MSSNEKRRRKPPFFLPVEIRPGTQLSRFQEGRPFEPAFFFLAQRGLDGIGENGYHVAWRLVEDMK